jgi:hypothetical protein
MRRPVAALQADDWDYESMQARMRFWNLAKPKLERLANRIGDIKPISHGHSPPHPLADGS